MAVVIRDRRVPRPGDILGVITKEHVADSVTDSVQIYPGCAALRAAAAAAVNSP